MLVAQPPPSSVVVMGRLSEMSFARCCFRSCRGATTLEYLLLCSLLTLTILGPGQFVSTSINAKLSYAVARMQGGGTETIIAGGNDCWKIRGTNRCYSGATLDDDNQQAATRIKVIYHPEDGTVEIVEPLTDASMPNLPTPLSYRNNDSTTIRGG